MLSASETATLLVAAAAGVLVALGVGACSDDEGGTEATSATVATFNAGLIDGFVPLARERLPANVTAIAESDFDVLCLQEVWSEDDVNAIINGQGSPYVDSYWVDTSEEPLPPQCTEEDVADLLGCTEDNDCDNSPDGLSSCAIDNCGTEIGELDSANPDCFLCLTSQIGDPEISSESIRRVCVEEGSYRFSAQGLNGLLLLSQHPMTSKETLDLDAFLTRRHVHHVEVDLPAVGPTDIFCTHLTTSQVVTYAGNSDSWADENADQIETIISWIDEQASTGQVILMGDFNAGPETQSLSAEDPENYALLPAAGFGNPFLDDVADPVCSFCESNTLRTGADTREGKVIDHILLDGFDDVTLTATRIFDQLVEITTSDGPAQSNLSDHFGIAVTIEP